MTNTFIDRQGEFNKRLSVSTSLLQVLHRVAPCLSGHIALIAALASVAFGTVQFSFITPHSRFSGKWKRWNPVNVLFSVCACVWLIVLFSQWLASWVVPHGTFFQREQGESMSPFYCFTARLVCAFPVCTTPPALLPAPFMCALVTNSSCAIGK